MIPERRQFLKQCGTGFLLAAITPAMALSLNVPPSALPDAPRIDYPEHAVREFLKIHFAGSRAFSARGLDKKERYLTRRFRQTMYKFFERSVKSGSSLPLVTDPFTGSQGANDYTVGDAKVRSEKAWVPVRLTDGRSTWTITYLMRNDQERNDDDWRIDDIEDVRGMSFTALLKKG